MNLDIRSLTNTELNAVLPELARLRITVFRDWPYLYDGSLDYEREYLEKFAQSTNAVCVAAFDGSTMVGAATGLPLTEADEEFSRPFVNVGYDINSLFYCSESVLLPDYRGRGIGHAFFDGRESHARALGAFSHSAFCGISRPTHHPLKPAGYVPLDEFWRKRGYEAINGLIASYKWKDIDQPNETAHKMQFWMKEL